jgi:hypothetical protein
VIEREVLGIDGVGAAKEDSLEYLAKGKEDARRVLKLQRADRWSKSDIISILYFQCRS